MSDFLFIVPEGWTQLDWERICNTLASFNAANVAQWAVVGMQLIEQPLKEAGMIPLDKTVTAVKLLDDSYFLVRLE